MDLLGGYGSNSDDENEEDTGGDVSSSSQNKESSPVTPTLVAAPFAGRIDAGTVSAGGRQQQAPGGEAGRTTEATKRRGRKLLKLSAVLPEHIWNQLSGGTASGSAKSSSGEADDSDDDQDYGSRPTRGGKEPAPTGSSSSPATGKPSVTGRDSGMLGLLQALPKTKSATSPNGQAGILTTADDRPGPADTTRKEGRASVAVPPSPSSNSLGAAFMVSTVETTVRKQSSARQVRDIHGANPAKPQIHQPQDGAHKETEDASLPSDHPETSSRAVPPPSSFLMGNRQPLPRPSVSRTSTLPSSRHVAAAPTTSFAPGSYPPRYHVQSQNAAPPASADASGAPATGVGPGKKQSRKRQMEQLLRAGRLEEIQEDQRLEGSANVYVAPDPTAAAGGGGVGGAAASTYHGHGLRVVPTAKYNVGTGGTVATTDVTVRQKGKHQLNSLLASAATLEAHRAQNPLFGQGGGGGGAGPGAGSHRASAKRKYGW
jgi:hypothetical protein